MQDLPTKADFFFLVGGADRADEVMSRTAYVLASRCSSSGPKPVIYEGLVPRRDFDVSDLEQSVQNLTEESEERLRMRIRKCSCIRPIVAAWVLVIIQTVSI